MSDTAVDRIMYLFVISVVMLFAGFDESAPRSFRVCVGGIWAGLIAMVYGFAFWFDSNSATIAERTEPVVASMADNVEPVALMITNNVGRIGMVVFIISATGAYLIIRKEETGGDAGDD